MTDNSSPPAPDQDENHSSSDQPLNVDATWVPSESNHAEKEDDNSSTVVSDNADDSVDYGATVTGRPLPSDPSGDEDLDASSEFGVTLVPDAQMENSANSTPTYVPETSDHASPQGSFEATIVGDLAGNIPQDGTDRDNEKLEAGTVARQSDSAKPRRAADLKATNPLDASSSNSAGKLSSSESSSSASGTGMNSGTHAESKLSSQIWTSSAHNSLDELISIRTRSVSGTGQFTQTPNADFEIVEKLAEGGMGVVYVAKQRSLNRELAIKTLKGTSGTVSGTIGKSNIARVVSRADRQKREMFLSEALVTANLVHPNIIPIHELAETDAGMPYYVMKRVHGIPWNKRIQEMSLQENLDVLHKVCDAIAYAHHNGVINRDLKPENIMLGEFGEVLVLDWGLAVPAPHAAEQNFRSPVASFGAGTPAYMSPELWTGPPEAIGECSDIYLLGAILYEIVAGNPPHDFPKQEKKDGRSDVWKTVDEVLRKNVIRQTSKSGELLDTAYKAMKTNPDERFGSVLELQFAVRNFQRHEESRRLSTRAEELIDSQKAGPRDYHTCQTAAALYEESLRTWPQNGLARNGLRSTRLIYAQLASSKGDYDLGLQVATQEKDPEFLTIAQKLKTAKRIRSSVKWTALAAMLCVVALGAKSIYDNGIITNLNEEVTVRKTEASRAIVEAEDAKQIALTAKTQADEFKLGAENAQREASIALAAAEKANTEATDAMAAATTSKMEANIAVSKAEEANRQVVAANEKLVAAERSTAAALLQQEKAETAAKVATVEIQSASIRGLTLNENYSDALREINRLLEGELLPALPEAIRIQRTAELQAQREQLLKRARRSDEPIQTQAISPDRKWLALGDATGTVVVISNPSESLDWPMDTRSILKAEQAITDLRFVDSGSLLIAAGNSLLLWQPGDDTPQKLEGHSAQIRGIDTQQNLAISGDESGHLIVWDLVTASVLAELNANTSIRDVIMIPGTRDFLYAGARGGRSSDILAYRIPETKEATTPIRIGQLRMSRQHNNPPSQLSVSPDGSLLVISNTTNGDVFVLPRLTKIQASSAKFPFAHPADLESEGNMTWLLSHHSRPVNDLQWSEDGQRFLTASDDRRVGLWDRVAENNQGTSLQFQRYLRGHGARVTQAEFINREASKVASASTDGFSRLWDLQTLDDDHKNIRKAFNLSMQAEGNLKPVDRRFAAANHAGLRSSDRLSVGPMLTSLPAPEDASKELAIEPANNDSEVTILNEELTVHRGPVRTVRFSEDGKQLVSGADDGSVVVWDTKSRQPVSGPDKKSVMRIAEQFQEGHDFNISRMKVVGPQSNLLATAGFDGSLRLWDLSSSSGRQGVQQQVVAGLGLVNAFAASPDGRFLVTSAVQDQSTKVVEKCSVWSIADLLKSAETVPVSSLQGIHQAEVTAIAVSTDSTRIATGGRDGIIAIWDASSSVRLAKLRAHGKDTIVTALEWLTDGTLLSAGLDGKLTRWSLERDTQNNLTSNDSSALPQFQLKAVTKFERAQTPIEQLSLSPDQSRLLVLSVETDRVRKTTSWNLDQWTLNAPEAVKRIAPAVVFGKQPQTITSAQWSADGKRVLVSADTGVQIFDSETWKVNRVFAAGFSGATDAQFVGIGGESGNQEQVVTFDGTTASLWNLDSGNHVVSFHGPYPVTSVATMQSSDFNLVLTAGESLRVFCGDAHQADFGRPLFHLQKSHHGRITSIAVSAGSSHDVLTAGVDGNVIRWRWNAIDRTVTKSSLLASHTQPIQVVRWSSDGNRILVVAADGLVQVLNQKGVVIASLRPGEMEPIELLAAEFSQDGKFVVAGGLIVRTSESIGWVLRVPEDQTETREKNVDSEVNTVASNAERNIVCSFSGHEAGGISSVSFIAGTPYAVTGGKDGSLILWNWQNALPGETPTAYEAYRFLRDNKLTAHQASVTSLSAALTGEICSGSEDGSIVVWSLPLLSNLK